MKKFLTALLAVVLFCLGVGAANIAQRVQADICPHFSVIVDGEKQTFTDANGAEVYPLVYNGTTYLPVRAIGNLMGKDVGWDGATSTITLNERTAYAQVKSALTKKEIKFEEVKMAAESIGAADGYKYKTDSGNIEIYRITDQTLLSKIKESKTLSTAYGDFAVFVNGNYIMLSNDFTKTEAVQAIFANLK